MRSQTSIVTELKNRRYITGCISCMPLIVTVNTTAECPQTDCNIMGGETKILTLARKKYSL
jgi:hypothetical protein